MASESPADSPVESPWYRQREAWKRVLAGLAMIVTLAIWYLARDDSYRFDFRRITSARDTKLLLDLHHDLNAVEKWRPWNLLSDEKDRQDCQDRWRAVVAGFIDGFEKDDRPEKWSDLLKSRKPDDPTATEPVELTRLDLYNSLVDFLRINAATGAFGRLKTCPLVTRQDLLKEEFETALDNWRQKKIERLVGAKRNQADSRFDDLLQEHGGKLFPTSENRSALRSAARWIVGRTDYAEMKAWVDEYCTSCRQHLEPVATFRKILQRTEVLPLRKAGGSETGRSDELGLLIKLSRDGGEVKRDGRTGLLETEVRDAKLLLRLETEDKGAIRKLRLESAKNGKEDAGIEPPARSLETGIRLIGLTLTQESNQGITYQWPPKSFFVDSEVLLRLMRDLGMPRGFRLAKATATPKTDTSPKNDVVHLSCQVVHPHLPGYSHPLEVDLGDKPIQVTIDELQSSLKTWTNSAEFKEYMKGLPKLWEVTVAENTQVKGEDKWRCTLKYPFGKVSLDLTISDAGELLIFGQPTRDECQQIIKQLLEPEEYQGFLKLAHVLSVGDCQVDPHSGDLKGTLSIHGTLIDSKEDMTNVPWTIARADATSTMELDRKRLFELRSLNKRLSQKLEELDETTTDTAKSVNEKLKAYLDEMYPHLVGSIESTRLKKSDGTLTNRIVLRLLIGDWPELRLVSRDMTADNIKVEIDRLLSEKNIRQQAQEQWKTARTTVSFSGVERQLTGWDPKTGDATVGATIRLPIGKRNLEIGRWVEIVGIRKSVGGSQQKWDRFIVKRDDSCVRFSEAELCELLKPTRNRVERELSDALSELVQGKVEVKAEPDGFGPGLWLRVNPPAIRIAIEMPVPLLPVQVRAGQILCEARDPYVHLPEEWTVIYLRTFLVPPPGNFSVSDPMIRVNFRKKELGLGCKLTPPYPVLPGVNAEKQAASHSKAAKKTASNFLKKVGIKTPSFTLRPDNLWLHLAYLEIDLHGGLKDRTFGAKGHLQMLGSYRAAAAELSVAMKDNPSLNAHLETGRFPVPYIAPEISGVLQLNGDGLEMDTAFNLVGARLNGHMYYETSDSGPGGFAKLGIDGRIRLPFIGLADAHVQSDPAMKRLKIMADGVTLLPMGRFRFRFRAHFNRQADGPPIYGYDLHIEQIDSKGVVLASFSRVGNSLRELDDEEIADAIRGQSQDGQAKNGKGKGSKRKRLSAKGRAALTRLPVGTPHKQPEAPVPHDERNNGGKDIVRARKAEDYKWEYNEDPESKSEYPFNFVHTKTGRKNALNVPVENKELNWFWESDTRTYVLFHSKEEKKTVLVELQRDDDHAAPKLKNLFTDVEEREFQTYEDQLSAQAVMKYVSKLIKKKRPSTPEWVESGYLIRWQGDTGTPSALFVFQRENGTVGSYNFRASEIPEELWSETKFHDLLKKGQQDNGCFVVDADTDSGCLAFVKAETATKDCDRITIVSTRKKTTNEVFLTHFKNSSSRSLRAAKLIVDRLGQSGRPAASDPLPAFVGQAGVAIAGNSQIEFYHPLDGDGSWFVIDRETFKAWEHSNSRHLPVNLRKPDQRDDWWRYRQVDLLRELLRPWEELRREKQWGANPLGLLQGLAAESSPTAVE